jgi:hypothetical protein
LPVFVPGCIQVKLAAIALFNIIKSGRLQQNGGLFSKYPKWGSQFFMGIKPRHL